MIEKEELEKIKKELKIREELSLQSESITIFEEVIKERPEDIFKIDDEFEFDFKSCMNCIGDCCFDRGDLIHVIGDIDYIQQSNKLKHKTKVQILKKFFTIYFDKQIIPFISFKTIKRKFYGEYQEICPFWKWIKKEKGFGGICELGQKYKPSICLLFPLGSFILYNDKKNCKEQYYFNIKCKNHKTANKIPIKLFIGNHPKRIETYSIIHAKIYEIKDFIIDQINIAKEKEQNTKQEKKHIDILKMKYLSIMYYVIYYDDVILNTINKVLEAIKNDTLPEMINEIMEFLRLNDLINDLHKTVDLIIYNFVSTKSN